MNKQDQELNLFEESFSSVSSSAKPDTTYQHAPPGVDNWVSDISSYTYDSNSINDSYSSVSTDNQTTIISSSSEDNSENAALHNNNAARYEQSIHPPQLQQQVHFVNSTTTTTRPRSKVTKKKPRKTKVPEDEEKRKNFLERNRIAALKCRQRKKQWLSNLQARVEYLANDNDQLALEADALRNEILNLKTLLVGHKDCPQYNAALGQRDSMYRRSTNTTAMNQ